MGMGMGMGMDHASWRCDGDGQMRMEIGDGVWCCLVMVMEMVIGDDDVMLLPCCGLPWPVLVGRWPVGCGPVDSG